AACPLHSFPTRRSSDLSNHPEFGLMSPTHISIRNLLRLNVLVQFLLTIFQTHCDIRRALGPPEEIKVIAETLALIKGRHRPKHRSEEHTSELQSRSDLV